MKGRVSPQLAAFLTLTVVALLCAGAVYLKMELSPPPPSSFTPVQKPATENTRVVQLRFESTPPGATVTGPHGLTGTTPFFIDVPRGETLNLRFDLPGHAPQMKTVTADQAALVSVVMQPLP